VAEKRGLGKDERKNEVKKIEGGPGPIVLRKRPAAKLALFGRREAVHLRVRKKKNVKKATEKPTGKPRLQGGGGQCQEGGER